MESARPVPQSLSAELGAALSREWLAVDGHGGFANTTAAACPARRYHGWLVAVPPGFGKRHVFLSRFLETWSTEGADLQLSADYRAGMSTPNGASGWSAFEAAAPGLARFTYRAGKSALTRELLLVRGTPPTLLVRYALAPGSARSSLELRPLLAFREADALTFANDVLDTHVEHIGADAFRCRPYEMFPPLAFRVAARAHAPFETDPAWERGIEYPFDLARGYDGIEDHFAPGGLRVELEPGEDCIVAVRLDEEPLTDARAAWTRHAPPESPLETSPGPSTGPSWTATLARSAEDFLYRARDGRLGVIAGFPWFGEWGRDTYISLPGLTLARGDVDSCAEILHGALDHLRAGLLPNIFGEADTPSHYGSADAALWFVRAVRAFELAAPRPDDVRTDFAPALASIADAYLAGTELGLRVDERGLLLAGDQGLNATWMDARTPAGPVTPRAGAAVELNALWYFLLAYLDVLEPGGRWGPLRKRSAAAFLEHFWLADEARLADVVPAAAPTSGGPSASPDRRVRPNMVLAAALELSPLSRPQRRAVVDCAERELLTPRGLRTLACDDPDYRGRYEGSPDERDGAYHQGTVWPWLIGSFCEAYVRSRARLTARERTRLRALLSGFAPHLEEAGIGHVSEVFDGDAPQRPAGCFAQAWSSAELLRAHTLIEAGEPTA